MNFEWKQIDEFTLVLISCEKEIIATASWIPNVECWYLESSWLDHSSDFCGDFGLNDIEGVKAEAIELLKNTCNEHIDWYKGQIENLEKVSDIKNSSL